MKEFLGNILLWQILFSIILLILPSPLLKKTREMVGDTIKGAGEKKAKDIAYKILTDFAEGLKDSKYNGDINLTSNDQIDDNLNKYKISLDLMEPKSKVRDWNL